MEATAEDRTEESQGELIPLIEQPANPVELFRNNGLDPLLEAIDREAKKVEVDLTTGKGRKAIASVAHKVARSKTLIDDAGKILTADMRAEIQAIDAERRRARNFLDELKQHVREPLTEWEEERKKVDQDIAHIRSLANDRDEEPPSSTDIANRLEYLDGFHPEDVPEDKRDEFKLAIYETRDALQAKHETALQREREAAEAERKRQEEEERAQREREEQIRREAEEKAQREAEERAQKEREEAERKAREEREEAERQYQEQLAEERRKHEEEKRQAEQARREEEEANRREQEEAERRARNREHCGTIDRAAANALMSAGLSETDAKAAVAAIASGQVPNVTITY